MSSDDEDVTHHHQESAHAQESLVSKSDKEKRPAKESENDKAKLLEEKSDNEVEEDEPEFDDDYTDIFAEQSTGQIISSVQFEDGEVVSSGEADIDGHTADVDKYVDKPSEDVTAKSKVRGPKEGKLIDVGDGYEATNEEEVFVSENGESDSQDLSIPAVTNDKISEIAEKLIETNLAGNISEQESPPRQGKSIQVIDRNQYMKDLGFRDSSHSELSSEEDSRNGYSSSEGSLESTEPAWQNKFSSKPKKKKLLTTRQRRMSLNKETVIENGHDTEIHSDDILGEIDPLSPKKKGFTQISPVHSFNKEVESKEKTSIENEVKETQLIDSMSLTDINDSNAVLHNNVRKQKKGTEKTRKKPRHKIYKDDPDIHQCINDHASLLRQYLNDIKEGKFGPKEKKEKRAKSGGKHSGYQSLPDVSYAGTKHSNPPDLRGAKSMNYMGPYDGHGQRGKTLIARMRNDDPSNSSSSGEEDDDEYTDRTVKAASGRHRKGSSRGSSRSGGHSDQRLYEPCPDCGERHPIESPDDIHDVCPDCGVPHNPFQHRPGAQDPDESKLQDSLPSIEGPHTLDELTDGTRYRMKYLGSSQITTQHPVTKETRMQQAQDAYSRIKGADGDDSDAEPSTEVDMLISLERIKILNRETKFEDVMMDHALRTVCFICDMGNILVLMARRLTSDQVADMSVERGKPITLANIVAEREKRTSKNICHVFECGTDASKVAKAIGQAFNIAYRQFLQSNGISHEHVEEAEYCHVLESQKLVGEDLDKLTDNTASRDVVVTKKRGESLGVMLLESGWGSMLPTVFIAHIANYSPSAICQQLTVGDHILSCNGASLVGLPLSECNTVLRNVRSSNRVVLKVVSCPPVVDVVVSRPDTKYQLGFSVQNGTICSLLRGGIAERGGIRVGHRIIEINGDSVVAKTHQNIVDILANTVGSISMKTMPVAMYRLMVGEDQPQHV